MEPEEKILLCDLDGTLSSSKWRDPLVEGDRKRWPEYYKGIPFDNIVPKVKAILEKAITDGCRIIYITAREESLDETRKRTDGTVEKTVLPVRKWTEDWLSKHSAPGWGSGALLFMRKHKDHRPSSVVKEDVIKKYLGGNKTGNIVMGLDDNENVITMYKRYGIKNSILVSDPGIPPNLQKQHDDFMKTVPTAQVLLSAAKILIKT